jgi:hypothetical protein
MLIQVAQEPIVFLMAVSSGCYFEEKLVMRRRTGLIVLICLCCSLSFAGYLTLSLMEENIKTDSRSLIKDRPRDLVNCEDPSAWEGMVKVNTQIKRSEKGSFELYGEYQTEIISSQMIPVDINKTYVLSTWMRSLSEKLPASGYFGIKMYDEKKREIVQKNITADKSTEMRLVTSAVKGSKELYINANKIWLNKTFVVVFNVKEDYKDLPNFDCSPRIKKVIDEGWRYKVILSGPLSNNYPAGTKVRIHWPWTDPLFWIAKGWMPTTWKKFSTTLKGEAKTGTPKDKFWTGTKYVRVFAWFGNMDLKPQKGARLLVDDIKFIQLD